MRTIQEDFREYAYLDRKRTTIEGITAREYGRWLLLRAHLEKAFSKGPPEDHTERRGSLRVPTRLQVTYDAEAGLEGTVTNLSRTGCCVITDLPSPTGTRLTLLLRVASGGEPLELPVEVACMILGASGERGMGLRFLDLPPEIQKRLDDLYDGLELEVRV